MADEKHETTKKLCVVFSTGYDFSCFLGFVAFVVKMTFSGLSRQTGVKN
jgi:hypothetical protein